MELILENICYRYPQKTIFKNLNMKIPSGKISGIIGDHGCGKTTLLKIIMGMKEYNGTVLFNNEKLNKNNIAKIGVVFDNENYFLGDTILKQLKHELSLFNLSQNEIDKRIDELCELCDLSKEYLNKKIINLSTSEKSWVSFLSVIAADPEVIILDNLTSKLDYDKKQVLARVLKFMKHRLDKTIIIVGHDIDFMHKIVDYFYIVAEFKIAFSGRKYDVFKDSELMELYGIKVPKLIEFSNKVMKKKEVKIGYRDEINDLIKDIYRYVK